MSAVLSVSVAVVVTVLEKGRDPGPRSQVQNHFPVEDRSVDESPITVVLH